MNETTPATIEEQLHELCGKDVTVRVPTVKHYGDVIYIPGVLDYNMIHQSFFVQHSMVRCEFNACSVKAIDTEDGMPYAIVRLY